MIDHTKLNSVLTVYSPFHQIATGFVTNGAKVYIASRSLKACKETADRLNAMGPGKCIPLAADLSKYDDCVRLAKELGEKEQSEFSIDRRWSKFFSSA